ncbi:MAG: glutathione S-transferase family protein [Myxococcales bacterium]|jgi:glutathione S-transferase|nr:glutathione S-transferase family protein [Myxococcales bacterium]
MKLYTHPLSTYARRVTMAALEKGIELETVVVDMAAREHRGEAYKKLNPYGRVPTLVDGDLVLYESTAILEYLEDRFPSPPLVPEDAADRARTRMHMKLCDLQLTPQTSTIIFPKRFIPKDRWRLDAMEKAKQEIEAHLAILDRELEGKTWLVAERFTLAELAYAPFLDFLGLMEIAPPPNVGSWAARMLARPSAQATKPPL